MRYVSLFSGIEAASVAWEPLGWEPVAFCEVDAFPSAVLARRWPGVPNLGDVTEVDWGGFSGRYGAVDVVVGGSPCQSFSVAGGREGLDGESRLVLEYIRAVRDLRPRWFLWENVPGVLSVDAGRAFGILLHEMDELGYGLAWRVLDAQFFGVAQRRRRVFLVGRLGDGAASAAVLFERESVRGNTKTSREKRQELAGAAGFGAHGEGECLTPWDVQSKRVYSPDGCAPTLNSGERTGGSIQPSVLVEALPFNTTQVTSRQNGSNPQWGDPCHTLAAGDHPPAVVVCTQYGDEIAGTLTARHDSSPCADRGQNVVCMADDAARAAVDDDMCGTLKCGGAAPAVAFADVADCLTASYGTSWNGNASAENGSLFARQGPVVRRLTPLECERLQGFPDGWTDIPYKGKEHPPDTPRYRALGNSMAVPVIRWLGERISEVEEEVLSLMFEGVI